MAGRSRIKKKRVVKVKEDLPEVEGQPKAEEHPPESEETQRHPPENGKAVNGEEIESQIEGKELERKESQFEKESQLERKEEEKVKQEEEAKAEETQEQRFKKPLPYEVRKLVRENEKGERYIMLEWISTKSIKEIMHIAKVLGVERIDELPRHRLIMKIMEILSERYGVKLHAEGVLDVLEQGGYGFLRFTYNNYARSNDDVFVPSEMITKNSLRTGDVILGEIKPPEMSKFQKKDERVREKYFRLVSIYKVNYQHPSKTKERTIFENLTPYFPTKKFNLDWQEDGDLSCRIVDIIAPIGKGQRGLIVSPPRAGKTTLMQNIAKAILTNHPEVIMIILLIDERPEEVTDWKKNVASKFKDRKIEVIASTFDEEPEKHIHAAEIVLNKAKRLVEYGYDVVILLDSITRLTRAYNQHIPSSGKVLTGGIDSAALVFPKKFFGAARAIEDGGSLTILATCLIDTGSRMDEVIFEEFKGTGNMEIYLDRRLAEKRVFPAIDVHRSGTRREELLHPKEIIQKIWLLRKVLQPLTVIEAAELLHDKMSQTRNNKEFFEMLTSL